MNCCSVLALEKYLSRRYTKAVIYLLFGENEFEKRQKLIGILGNSNSERFDGEDLTREKLQELAIGQTLFGGRAVAIINELSKNAELWAEVPDYFENTERTIIFLETKLDKRTKTYKWLQKCATIETFEQPSGRQISKVVQWCVERAKKAHQLLLPTALAEMIVGRLGTDMMRLDMVLSQLALSEEVNAEFIEKLLPLPRSESAFELFEAALKKDAKNVKQIIHFLEPSGSDVAYQTLGLLVQQANSLVALSLANGDKGKVAQDFNIHPFSLSKLADYSVRLTPERAHSIVDALFVADMQMKTTSVDPWLAVEIALVKICQR